MWIMHIASLIVGDPPEILYNNMRVENELVFLRNEPEQPAAVQLMCYVESHPTTSISISWSRGDNIEASGLQNISRFRLGNK